MSPEQNKTDKSLHVNGIVADSKCISYEFGFSKINSVDIVERDSLCDVYISDSQSKTSLSTTCKKVPILKWTFDELENELSRSQFIIEDGYKSYYYKLTLKNKKDKIIVDSSSKHNDDSEIAQKINELKEFIINLWTTECVNK